MFSDFWTPLCLITEVKCHIILILHILKPNCINITICMFVLPRAPCTWYRMHSPTQQTEEQEATCGLPQPHSHQQRIHCQHLSESGQSDRKHQWAHSRWYWRRVWWRLWQQHLRQQQKSVKPLTSLQLLLWMKHHITFDVISNNSLKVTNVLRRKQPEWNM